MFGCHLYSRCYPLHINRTNHVEPSKSLIKQLKTVLMSKDLKMQLTLLNTALQKKYKLLLINQY